MWFLCMKKNEIFEKKITGPNQIQLDRTGEVLNPEPKVDPKRTLFIIRTVTSRNQDMY